jgi:hypothetical protein
MLAKQHAQRASALADTSELTDELRTVRGQLQQAQQRSASGAPSLPEELEPLRWTLKSAIEALTALEGREPALASHLRNLRLLASTLQKLSSDE